MYCKQSTKSPNAHHDCISVSYNVAKLFKEKIIMSANTVVRAGIDDQTKKEALPFEPWNPNAETLAAMQQARQEKLPRFDNIDALMADLN